MSSTSSPAAGPQPAVCYRCGQPLQGVCVFCGRFFCYQHGSVWKRACRPHARILTAAALAVATLLFGGTVLVALASLR